MTVIEQTGNGADPWCAVAAHPSGWAFAWNNLGVVRFEFADGQTFSRAVPGDFLRYLDAASNPIGDVAVIGVGNDDYAYLVGTWFPSALPLDKVFGNFPVGVYWDGLKFVPVQVVSATHYTRNRGPQDMIRIGATSQGIRQLRPDSSIVWGDETHVIETHGRTIHKYAQLGDVYAGQRNGPDHIDLYDGRWWTPIHGSAQPPRLVHLANGYGVCAATNHGAVLAVGPPWPLLISDVPVPEPPDPEPPDPEPPDPEPPVSIPNGEAIVRDVSDAHPQLIAQNTTDTIRELYWRSVWALHEHDHNFGWLSKSSSENHQVIDGQRVAVDAVAYKGSDQVVDIFKSAGDGPGKGGIIWDLTSRRPSNVWLQPVPFPDGIPVPDPPPPPNGDLAEAVHNNSLKITELQQQMATLTARVDVLSTEGPTAAILSRLAHLEAAHNWIVSWLRRPASTSRSFAHGHSVTILPPGENEP